MLAHAVLALAACQFERPADRDPPVDASADAAPPACTPSTQSCTGDLYSECDADGNFVVYETPNGAPDGSPATLTMSDYPCPLGCHATEPRCLDVAPSNELAVALDASATSASGIDLVIDDPSGEASLIDQHQPGSTSVTITLANGTVISVPAMVIPQPGGPDLRVMMVRSLTIRAASRLKLRAAKPIAIASHFDIVIEGTLDYSGTNNVASSTQTGCDVPFESSTGAGAGNASAGGASSTGQPGGLATTGNPYLEPLTNGCTSFTGIGGGGIQLVSRTRIAMLPGSLITIAGRRGQTQTSGGAFYVGGGGAGGNLLLEAPALGVASGAIVVGRGGSGAAGNPTTRLFADGVAGDADLTAPTVGGGVCPDCNARGGTGGTETSPAGGTGIGSPPATAIAGGGGAVGRAVFRTRSPFLPPSGTMKLTTTNRFISTR